MHYSLYQLHNDVQILNIIALVKYYLKASSGGKWVSFGTKIDPGDNLIELVVEAGGIKPSLVVTVG